MITQEEVIDNLYQLVKKYGDEFGFHSVSADGDNNSASLAFSVRDEGNVEDDPIFFIYSKDVKDVTNSVNE